MKKIIIATTVALCVNATLVPNSHANYSKDPDIKKEEKNNEAIGFGSGALAGAVVGGPVGAFVGGIFGLVIANDVNNDKQLAQAENDLQIAKSNLQQQQRSIQSLETELASAQQQQMVQLASFDDASHEAYIDELSTFETSLQFKTASFAIEDIYTEQLNSIASILKSYPQLNVKVVGYADQRGDEQYNRSLSEQRALSVKDYLIKENVKLEQITISGAGETLLNASNANLDNDGSLNDGSLNKSTSTLNVEDLFFARKVDISLVKAKDNMTAAN